jgi:hypothetical protein
MNAEFIIVLVITMFVLVVRAKIKSHNVENSYRREVNRRYREKRSPEPKLVYRKREA